MSGSKYGNGCFWIVVIVVLIGFISYSINKQKKEKQIDTATQNYINRFRYDVDSAIRNFTESTAEKQLSLHKGRCLVVKQNGLLYLDYNLTSKLPEYLVPFESANDIDYLVMIKYLEDENSKLERTWVKVYRDYATIYFYDYKKRMLADAHTLSGDEMQRISGRKSTTSKERYKVSDRAILNTIRSKLN